MYKRTLLNRMEKGDFEINNTGQNRDPRLKVKETEQKLILV